MFNYNGIPLRTPRIFDSRDLGTPESYWQAELSNAPVWTLPEGPVVVVAAHPDDETFGAGGLIHSCCRAGREVTVITVTDGEGARTDLAHPGAVRRRELRAAKRAAADGFTNLEKYLNSLCPALPHVAR